MRKMERKEAIYYEPARDLFVKKNKNLREISEIIPVSPQTLSKWKADGDWDREKKAYLTSPQGAVEILKEVLLLKTEEIRGMTASEIDAGTLDSLAKLVAMITRLEKEADPLAQTIFVFEKFSGFVREKERDSEKIDWISKMMQGFFENVRN